MLVESMPYASSHSFAAMSEQDAYLLTGSTFRRSLSTSRSSSSLSSSSTQPATLYAEFSKSIELVIPSSVLESCSSSSSSSQSPQQSQEQQQQQQHQQRPLSSEAALKEWVYQNCKNTLLSAMTLRYEHEQSELEKSTRRLRLLDKITQTQRRYLENEPYQTVFGGLLDGLLEVMDCEYGFIGEIKYEEDGTMYLLSHTYSHIAWDEESRTAHKAMLQNGVRFYNMNSLIGAVMTSRQPVVSNNPSTDSRACGLPPGHPPLHNFLGIPFFKEGGEINGMVGIANRPGGFGESDAEFLEPFRITCSNLIQGYWQIAQNKHLINTLEEKVSKRTRALQLANQHLKEANERVTKASAAQLQHFACMSHEIRTPLNCIIGLSSLLQETDMNPMQQESVQMIVSSGDLLLTVVNDVLDYAKLESGNVDITIEPSNLQETLNSVVHSIQLKAQYKQLTLSAFYDAAIPEFVMTDSRRLQQVLYNLLGNAIKFSKEGGVVELSVRLRSATEADGRVLDQEDVDAQNKRLMEDDDDEESEDGGGKSDDHTLGSASTMTSSFDVVSMDDVVSQVSTDYLLPTTTTTDHAQTKQADNDVTKILPYQPGSNPTPVTTSSSPPKQHETTSTTVSMTTNTRPLEESGHIDEAISKQTFSILEKSTSVYDLEELLTTLLKDSRDEDVPYVRVNPPDKASLPEGSTTFHNCVLPVPLSAQHLSNPGRTDAVTNGCGKSSSKRRRQQQQQSQDRRHRPKQYLQFQVKDYGKGIERKDFGRIFKPFLQASAETERVYGGTGLGLAITAKLVQGMGGTIAVDSQEGEWSTFTVDFPFDEAPADLTSATETLKTATVVMVYQESVKSSRVSKLFRDHDIDFQRVDDMAAMESFLMERNRTIHKKRGSYICLVHEDLFRQLSSRRKKELGIAVLFTFGPNYSIKNSGGHYRSLIHTLPSVFLNSIALSYDLSKQKHCDAILAQQPSTLRASSIPHLEYRVLIAEDNVINQKVLLRMLHRLGLTQVVVVDNGREAVEREAAEQFDVLLMDMQMPEMDGITACKQIVSRQNDGEKQQHPQPTIIFVTAHVSHAFETECLRAGASGFIPKPFNIRDIEECFQKLPKPPAAAAASNVILPAASMIG